MHNIWTIAKREYSLYFSSPIAYVVAFVILLLLGILFYGNLQWAAMNQGYIPGADAVMYPLGFFIVLLTPAITTRLLAEERRLGTIELLLTAPVRDWELVVGKWLGGLMLFLTILAISFIYPIILNGLVDPGIDQGPLVSGYIGLILLSAAVVALGVFASSLFSNQVAAFLTTLGLVIFVWWIIGLLAQVAGTSGSGATLLSYLDFSAHFSNNMVRGILDLKDIIYYLSVTALSLFFATMSVEIRRWG
jgi:ABC-2 type transport system permease protein